MRHFDRKPAVWERTITTLVCFVGHTTASRGPARSCLSSPNISKMGPRFGVWRVTLTKP